MRNWVNVEGRKEGNEREEDGRRGRKEEEGRRREGGREEEGRSRIQLTCLESKGEEREE